MCRWLAWNGLPILLSDVLYYTGPIRCIGSEPFGRLAERACIRLQTLDGEE